MGPLGFGGGAIGNLYRSVEDELASQALRTAFSRGIRYFDTAPHYGFGLSERRIGAYLRELDPTESVVLSTKVGRKLMPADGADLRLPRHGFVSPEPFDSVFDYGRDSILRTFDGSRRRIGRPIDILYAHDLGTRTHAAAHPMHFKTFMDECLPTMQRLREQGAVRAIGLGVNETQVCEEVLSQADLDIILLAGRYTLLEQDALDMFLPLCERRGVAVVIGGPFNSGILARGEDLRGPGSYDYGDAPAEISARASALQAVCVRHGVPLAAAALQFPLAHPAVVSVIPGLQSPAEVEDAARWMGLPIPAAFWQELREAGLIRRDAAIPAAPCMNKGSREPIQL